MDQSFWNPLQCSDGSPYAPKKVKEIIQECWYITDQLHTSYDEALHISYIERQYLLAFIRDKQDATQKELERLESARRANKGRK